MNRILAASAVIIAGVAGTAYWMSDRTTLPPFGAAEAQEASEVDTSMVTEMSLGNPDADVTVVEYASFTCPHCANFHADSFDELKSSYIETDKINYIYREVYFDKFGLWAAMMARCGGEDRYFGLVDLLYDNQREWIGDGDQVQIAENLKRIGKSAGLSQDEVDACMKDADMAEALVAVYQENSTRDGIQSTPSFLVNGNLVSGNNYDELKSRIDAALGE